MDKFCSAYNNSVCISCSFGYYFDSAKRCQQVNPLCLTYDSLNGNCLSCYIGYSLQSAKCIPTPQILDPNCYKFNGNLCIQCSLGYHFNSNKSCIQIDPLCQNFNYSSNFCSQCYLGYTIEANGSCTIITSPGCLIW